MGMKIKYRRSKLEKQMSNASEMKRAFGVKANRVSARKDDIISAPNLHVLMQIRAANCHPLTADRRGQWAVDISHNFRIIFEIDHNPIPENPDGTVNALLVTDIIIVEITDYH